MPTCQRPASDNVSGEDNLQHGQCQGFKCSGVTRMYCRCRNNILTSQCTTVSAQPVTETEVSVHGLNNHSLVTVLCNSQIHHVCPHAGLKAGGFSSW